jgi:hypothetical protein
VGRPCARSLQTKSLPTRASRALLELAVAHVEGVGPERLELVPLGIGEAPNWPRSPSSTSVLAVPLLMLLLALGAVLSAGGANARVLRCVLAGRSRHLRNASA